MATSLTHSQQMASFHWHLTRSTGRNPNLILHWLNHWTRSTKCPKNIKHLVKLPWAGSIKNWNTNWDENKSCRHTRIKQTVQCVSGNKHKTVQFLDIASNCLCYPLLYHNITYPSEGFKAFLDQVPYVIESPPILTFPENLHIKGSKTLLTHNKYYLGSLVICNNHR